MKKTLLSIFIIVLCLLFIGCKETTHDCEKNGHQFNTFLNNQNGTHTKTCKYDSTHSEIEKCKYGEWVEILAPGTFTEGKKERVCKDCGYREEAIISSTHVHEYSKEWTIDVAPTCDSGGIKSHHCIKDNCTSIIDETKIQALNHSYGDWSLKTAPTLSQRGLMIRICRNDRNHQEEYELPLLNKEEYMYEVINEATEEREGLSIYTYIIDDQIFIFEVVLPRLEHTHKYEAKVTLPTCEEKGYTTHACICGYSYIDNYTDALGHDIVELEAKEETCTEPGLTKGEYCTRCDHKVAQEIIPAKGHKYEAKVTLPTCEAQGYTTHTCHCGDSYNDNYTDELGHDIVELEAKEETCTEPGLTKGEYCTRCDYKVAQENIPAKGHKYEAKVTLPTCEEKGYTTYTCHCGDSYIDNYTDELGHAYGNWSLQTEPTLKHTGLMIRICSNDSKHQEEYELPLLNKIDFVYVVISEATEENDGLSKYTYTKDNQIFIFEVVLPRLEHTHKYEAKVNLPTCEAKGYTTYTCKCKDSYIDNYTEALGHDIVELEAKEETCTEPGLTKGEYCTRCDYKVAQEIVPAKGHKYEAKVALPTCEEKGYTTYTCHCGDSYIDNYTDELGHAYGNWSLQTEPTLKHTGLMIRICSNDSKHQEEYELPLLNKIDFVYVVISEATEENDGLSKYTYTKDNQIFIFEVVLPRLEHTHKYEAKVTLPTCEAKGYTTYTCKCKDSYIDNYTETLGHDIVELEAKEETCTEPGLTKGEYCTRCNYKVAQENIPAKGHKYEAKVTLPTCEAKGYTTYTCHCGDSYIDNYTDELGHAYGNWSLQTEPTLKHTGLMIRICSNDSKHQEEYELPLLNKIDFVYVVISEATEENDGLSKYTYTKDNQIFIFEVVLPRLEHTHKYEAKVNLPTCEAKGYTTYTCKCKDSYIDNYTEALGHDIVELEAKEETCTESGLTKGEYCTRCDYKVAQEIVPAKGHKYEAKVALPTCEEKGYTTYTCHCGDSYIDNYTDELGHAYGNWSLQTEPTLKHTGLMIRICSNDSKHQEEYELPLLNKIDFVYVVISEATEENDGLSKYTYTKDNQIFIFEVVLPRLEHTHKYEAKVNLPTCEAKGYTTYTCKCKDSYIDNYTEALGHDIVELEAKEETCTETGLTKGEYCTRCDYKVAQEIIPAKGHKYESEVTLPTCEAQGYTTYTCHCDDSYIDNYTDELGHAYGNWSLQTEPTLKHTGLMIRICSNDSKHQEEYELPLLNKIDFVYVVISEATEENDGLSKYTYTKDNQIFIFEVVLPRLEHTHKYEAKVTLPTCEAKGYTTYTCKCKDSYIDNYTETLGHDIVELEAKEETCTEPGLTKGEYCTRCNYKVAQEIVPAKGHKYEAKVTLPTCEEKGYTTYTCHCGDSYIDNYTDELGHDIVDLEAKEETCTEPGLTKGEYCTRCDYKVAQEIIPAKGHSYDDGICIFCYTNEWDIDGDGSLEILAIGNSFSVDALEYAYQIAQSLGVKKIAIGNLYIGGCTLATHKTNAYGNLGKYTYYFNDSDEWTSISGYKISSALESRSWDYISMQQGSHFSGDESSYNQDLIDLISYIKERSNAKLVWHMTWAYQQNSTHSAFPNYNNDQMTMYNAIVSAVKNKITTNHDINLVVPNGTAIQNSRTSILGDTTTRDGYHMSYVYGRYLTGLTFIKVITGLSIDDISYSPSGLSSEEKLIAIESVNNAILNPFEVTKSKYDSPENLDSGYIQLELDLHKGAYWYSQKENQYNTLVTNADNCESYFATIRFNRETLPIGSIIILENGWQYRPEGWVTDTLQIGNRESIVTNNYIFVTEEWWKDYTIRAFNISKKGLPSVLSISEEEVRAAFKIFVPEKLYFEVVHKYEAKVTLPTCETQGYTTYSCYCGYSYIDNYTDALGHNIVKLEAKEETCTEPGLTKGEYCTRCDYKVAQEIVPAKGHKYEAKVTLPTCEAKGYTTHTCYCGDSYNDNYVDPLQHILVYHDAKEATCLDNGYKAYEECTRCDYTTYEEVLATGHDYEIVVKEPTCTESGFTSHTCKNCTYNYIDAVVRKLGHDKTSYKYKAPTCMEVGHYSYEECSRCDYTTYSEIAKTDHKYSDSWIVEIEATYDNVGSKYRYCVYEGCGVKVDIMEIPRLPYSDGLLYELNSSQDGYLVSSVGHCTDIEINITPVYKELPVVGIKENAFAKCDFIKSVIIPNNIINIGFEAFKDCSNISSMIIPFVGDSLNNPTNTHFGYIFGASQKNYNLNYVPDSLEKVIITNSTVIYDNAFYNCNNLKYVELPDTVTQIGQYAFSGCDSLNTIDIPSCLSTIGDYSFYGWKGLTNITIPSTVNGIGKYAFANCKSIKYMFIPNSVTFIGAYAFSGSDNIVLYCNSESRQSGWESNWCTTNMTATNVIRYYLGINDSNFVEKEGIQYVLDLENNTAFVSKCISDAENITIPEFVTHMNSNYTVTSITMNSFENCTHLKTIHLSEGLESISQYAFASCSSLNSINIPSTLESISIYAFFRCISLLDIYIPSTVLSIGSSAFSYCQNLTVFCQAKEKPSGWRDQWNFNDIPVYWGVEKEDIIEYDGGKYLLNNDGTSVDMIKYVGNNDEVIIPNEVVFNNKTYSVLNIASCAFKNNTDLVKVTIPNSVLTIGKRAFASCSSLSSVIFGNNLTSIGERTFYDCDALTNLVIPDSVETIGYNSFASCDSLVSITLPANITSLDSSTFSSCSSLTSIIIPSKVTNINSSVFWSCSSLSSITLPSSLLNVSIDAFNKCTKLTDVYYYGTIDQWSSISFENQYSNPMNYGSHFYMIDNGEWKEVTNIIIPNTVTYLGDYQFYGFDNLTNIVIPNSLIKIGNYVFDECKSLQYNVYEGINYLGNDDNPYYLLLSLASNDITSINIYDETRIISSFAFSEAKNATSIIIPSSILSISISAFDECKNLLHIYYKGTIADWAKIYFANSRSNPMSFGEYFYVLDENNDWVELTEIIIPDTITELGNYQFFSFDHIVKAVVPESVTLIGEDVFRGAKSLETITIPYVGKNPGYSEITHFGYIFGASSNSNQFQYVPSTLTEVIVTNEDHVEMYAFNRCSNIVNISFTKNTLYLSGYSFEDCTSLKIITLPNTLIGFYSGAFNNCTGLSTVYYSGTFEEWIKVHFANETADPMYYADTLYVLNSKNEWVNTYSLIEAYNKNTIMANLDEINNMLYLDNEQLAKLELSSMNRDGSYNVNVVISDFGQNESTRTVVSAVKRAFQIIAENHCIEITVTPMYGIREVEFAEYEQYINDVLNRSAVGISVVEMKNELGSLIDASAAVLYALYYSSSIQAEEWENKVDRVMNYQATLSELIGYRKVKVKANIEDDTNNYNVVYIFNFK